MARVCGHGRSTADCRCWKLLWWRKGRMLLCVTRGDFLGPAVQAGRSALLQALLWGAAAVLRARAKSSPESYAVCSRASLLEAEMLASCLGCCMMPGVFINMHCRLGGPLHAWQQAAHLPCACVLHCMLAGQ